MWPVLRLLVCALFAAALTPVAPAPADDDKKRQEELKALDADFEKTAWATAYKKHIDVLKGKLARADRVELFRISPVPLAEGKAGDKAAFHGHAILSRFTVRQADQRKEVTAFMGRAFHWNFFRQAACFSPRHGLRVVQGRRTTDFLICFECDRVSVYEGEKETGSLAFIAPKSNSLEQTLRKLEKAKKAK